VVAACYRRSRRRNIQLNGAQQNRDERSFMETEQRYKYESMSGVRRRSFHIAGDGGNRRRGLWLVLAWIRAVREEINAKKRKTRSER